MFSAEMSHFTFWIFNRLIELFNTITISSGPGSVIHVRSAVEKKVQHFIGVDLDNNISGT